MNTDLLAQPAPARAAPADDAPRLSLLGTTALLFELPGTLELSKQQRVWALAAQLRDWPAVREAIPCLNNLMLVFREPPRQLAPFQDAVLALWRACEPLPVEGRLFDIPVHYGGSAGPWLEHVAQHTGLAPREVVRLHSEQVYTVFGLGSHPGHCYLAGLDPRLATPRRQVPLLDNPGGSVSIGGSQTSFSVSSGPTGWWAIGRTDLSFFDPAASPPARMQPGDRVRFHVQEWPAA